MFCYKCGKEISDESEFCMYCGAKIVYNIEPKVHKQSAEIEAGVRTKDPSARTNPTANAEIEATSYIKPAKYKTSWLKRIMRKEHETILEVLFSIIVHVIVFLISLLVLCIALKIENNSEGFLFFITLIIGFIPLYIGLNGVFRGIREIFKLTYINNYISRRY